MDRIGSIDESLIKKAIVRAILDEKASKAVSDTPEALVREEGCKRSVELLHTIGRSSVAAILYMEHHILAKELEQARDPISVASLQKAIEQIQVARKMLPRIYDPDGYKGMVEELPPQEREGNLPRDTVRRFFLSHGARLHDRIKHGLDASDGKLAILKQRLENIKQARKLYIDAQRNVLGNDWKPEVDYSVPPLPSERL